MTRTFQRGLTLIEMLVVVTLVSLMAAVAAPAVSSGVETVRLRTSGERLAATLRLARERAVRTRHHMEVFIEAPRVELRDLEGDSVRQWEMPESIQVSQTARYLFYPDGGVPAVRITLENSRRRIVTIEMDPMTAFPTVKEEVATDARR